MEKEWSPMPVSYPYQLTVKVWQLLIDLLLFSEDYAFFISSWAFISIYLSSELLRCFQNLTPLYTGSVIHQIFIGYDNSLGFSLVKGN